MGKGEIYFPHPGRGIAAIPTDFGKEVVPGKNILENFYIFFIKLGFDHSVDFEDRRFVGFVFREVFPDHQNKESLVPALAHAKITEKGFPMSRKIFRAEDNKVRVYLLKVIHCFYRILIENKIKSQWSEVTLYFFLCFRILNYEDRFHQRVS